MEKTITLGEFLNAMEKNGYRKTRENFFKYKDNDYQKEIVAACAMGQAYLNLNLNPSVARVPEIRLSETLRHNISWSSIVHMNDTTPKRVSTIAKEFKKKWANWLDETLTIYTDE